MSVAHREHEASARIGAPHYLAVWVVLVVLAAGSFLFSRIHPPEPWAILVALAVAAVKAVLVMLFFMHLWAHRGASRLAMAVAFGFIGLLMSLTVADVVTRLPVANPPQSRQARPYWKEQPARPWSGEPNQMPERQPHFEAP
ncbi:MAG TPA: cytochrome C oxidase subunit IV family protein [Myxococcales bacterium]|jgi:cytochrome c oxidase subunit 4